MSNYVESSQRRRRVRLTPVRPVPVEVTGDRAGEGPLTVGQLNIYAWVSVAPDDLYAILRVEFLGAEWRCRSMTWPRRPRY